MRILLTGGSGQLGGELAASLAELGEVIAPHHGELDLAEPERIREFVRRLAPDVIVNPAAYTAVDRAESEPEPAARVNTEAPGVLAQEAERHGALLIHYSTDFVFDGEKEGAYNETDAANPLNAYGHTKLEGERAVVRACASHWIFRTSWIYGVQGDNFLKAILKLAQDRDSLEVVADQRGTPNWARTIAQATAAALRFQAASGRPAAAFTGFYHLSAGGSVTRHDYARHIVAQAKALGMPLRLKPEAIAAIGSAAYPQAAARPKNSQLDGSKLEQVFGIALPGWQADVDACLAELIAGA